MSRLKKLKSIRSGVMSRGLSLAKLSVKAGGHAAKRAIQKRVSQDTPEQLEKYMIKQVELLSEEFGELKGSLMKVGQLISTYGEHFLPSKANEVLKKLQYQSPALEWETLRKSLLVELGPEKVEELEIEIAPHAAASIGQVHLAKMKETSEVLALKIQYPGVDKAVDTDIKYFKAIIGMLNVIPVGDKFDQIFDEVRDMLHQEVNYEKELEFTETFFQLVKENPKVQVPKPEPRYCSRRVMATHFISSEPFDCERLLRCPRPVRNEVAEAFLEHYLRELFQYKLVQTDPHFGNFRVHFEGENPTLVLLDFGAVRAVDEDFLKSYSSLIWGGLLGKEEMILKGASELGLILEDDPDGLKRSFLDLCFLITEPFAQSSRTPKHLIDSHENYLFDVSDLPSRVASIGRKIAFDFRLRCPPREVVFLDRKLGGAFTILAHLGARQNFRPLLEKILNETGFLPRKG